METVKVYTSDHGEAIIRCRACGRKKVANAVSFRDTGKKVKVTCPCGSSFLIAFEWRKHYRKPVTLSGDFLRDGSDGDWGAMEVKDISMGGVGIRTLHQHHLKVGDIIQVRFELDDSLRSSVSRNAIVRNANGWFLGVEFCDNKIDKALAFYVLP